MGLLAQSVETAKVAACLSTGWEFLSGERLSFAPLEWSFPAARESEFTYFMPLAAQASSVETEHNWQILKRDFLENLVKAALQESAVDVHNRLHARLSHAAGKRDGVAFADTSVKKAIGELIANPFQLVPGTHGGRHDADSFVFAHRFVDCVGHDFGV